MDSPTSPVCCLTDVFKKLEQVHFLSLFYFFHLKYTDLRVSVHVLLQNGDFIFFFQNGWVNRRFIIKKPIIPSLLNLRAIELR